MASLPYMPLWCSDYLGDTSHLTLEEHGAYLKILIVTWKAECRPFADDPERMSAILGIAPARWRKIRETLAPFFDLAGGTWRSPRQEEEWERCIRRGSASASNGKLGGRPKTKKKPNGINLGSYTEPSRPI